MKRVTIAIDKQVDLKFRKKASQIYKFEKGWYSKAVTDAMESWADQEYEPSLGISALMNSINADYWEKLKSDLNINEKNPFENMEEIINYFEKSDDHELEIDRDSENNIVISLKKNNNDDYANLDTLMMLHMITKIVIASMEETTKSKFEICGVETIPKLYIRKTGP